MQGIKHFRTYLQGTTFQIETDHDPLTHLASMKDSHGRLARWALALQPYQFTIVYRAGRPMLMLMDYLVTRVHDQRKGECQRNLRQGNF